MVVSIWKDIDALGLDRKLDRLIEQINERGRAIGDYLTEVGGLVMVRGLSALGVQANNLRGQATFATAATVAVTFDRAEPDTDYFVALAGSVNETFWVTSKTTTGFTLNSSNASSTATVDWILVR